MPWNIDSERSSHAKSKQPAPSSGAEPGSATSSWLAETTPPAEGSAAGNSPSAISAVPVRLPAGAKVGRYVVTRYLGGGGFGAVYAARDEELDRLVALKLPRVEHVGDEDSRRRFLEEARTVAQLRHPRIVSVFDVGCSDTGLPFVVLELFGSGSLDERLKSSQPTPHQAAAWVADIADALAEAHRRGFVHRDLKPANILLDAQNQPHISDFGLAVHESIQRGRSGELAGTFPYMSPEQIRGEVHRLDGRSDIWSLGVILYQLLTGRRPFAGSSVAELSDEIEHREPKPPRQWNSSLPAELERICLQAMAKAPAQRYSTAADMAQDLRTWLQASTATTPATFRSAGSQWAVLAMAGIVLCGLIGALLSQWLNPGRADSAQVPGPGDAAAEPPIASSAARLEVVVLDVQHLANQNEQTAVPQGIIGKSSFSARLRDHVTIEARLSRPAYAYLLAFRPDGEVEVCFPEDEDEPPPKTDRPRYPSVSRGVDYGLNEGTGLWLFAVIASEEPLPSFRDWRAAHQQIPWAPASVPLGTVFVDDGAWLETLTSGNRERGTRGKGVQALEKKPVTELIDWLKQTTDAEAVRGIGFGVHAAR